MRYATAAAFRDALEHRLRTRATEHLVGVNVLRKQVAIDRFLARLTIAAPGRWVVKGAYALDLRLGSRGRATRDVDLTRTDSAEEALRDMHEASATVGDDHFQFAVELSRRSLRPDNEQTSRFRVAADLAGRRFDDFTVDISFGELMEDEPDLIEGPDLLAFAGIPPTRVPAISLELQIAEKVHAYTRIYGTGRRNTRVKDLVDMVLIARKSKVRGPELSAALRWTFTARHTHDLPDALPNPPAEWAVPYRLLAETVGVPVDLAGAHRLAANLVGPALRDTSTGMWEPTDQDWRGQRARA